jgi:anaerobic selenocysteine-containing dehydrogenase
MQLKELRIRDPRSTEMNVDSISVLPALHEAQGRDGRLTRRALEELSRSLNVPPADLYGVATFYHYFNFEGLRSVAAARCRGPVCSLPGNHAAAEFLVVQDIFLTETAQMADVVLPAASFAETDGTFTNTERRVQRVRKAVEPPGEARADWLILSELSTRLGYRMTYNHPCEIWDELARNTPILAGINYDRIELQGIQWPCPTTDHPGTRYLHKDFFSRSRMSLPPSRPTKTTHWC